MVYDDASGSGDADEQSAHSARRGVMRAAIEAFACATLLVACSQREDPHPNSPPMHATRAELHVEVHDGAVTVRARDSNLEDVIGQIAERCKLRVVVQDSLDERVSVELQSLPLSTALRQLLRERSFVLQRTPQVIGTSETRHGTLWIFPTRFQPSRESERAKSAGGVEEPESFTGLERLERLSAALANEDANDRLDAVSALGQSDDDQAANLLASTASFDTHPSVRAEALYALGAINVDAQNQALRRALTDADRNVRKAAISALEEIGTESSVPNLAIALKDADASVRAAAADALGEIDGDAARRLLQQALSDESSVVREAAAE